MVEESMPIPVGLSFARKPMVGLWYGVICPSFGEILLITGAMISVSESGSETPSSRKFLQNMAYFLCASAVELFDLSSITVAKMF